MLDEKNMQQITNAASKVLGLAKAPTVELKNTEGGYARFITNKITMPIWTIRHGWHYSVCYLIHEVCHFLFKRGCHSAEFHRVEKALTMSLGFEIVRPRTYVNRILYLGELVYDKNEFVKPERDGHEVIVDRLTTIREELKSDALQLSIDK